MSPAENGRQQHDNDAHGSSKGNGKEEAAVAPLPSRTGGHEPKRCLDHRSRGVLKNIEPKVDDIKNRSVKGQNCK